MASAVTRGLIAAAVFIAVFALNVSGQSPDLCQVVIRYKVGSVGKSDATLAWNLNSCKMGPRGNYPWYEIILYTKNVRGPKIWRNSTFVDKQVAMSYHLTVFTMPFLTINTNLPRSKIPAGFCSRATDMLSELLGKPKEAVCVHVNADQLLTYAGTDEPAGCGSLSAIGKVGGALNKPIVAALYKFLENELGIDGSRLGIEIRNLTPTEVARGGKTAS